MTNTTAARIPAATATILNSRTDAGIDLGLALRNLVAAGCSESEAHAHLTDFAGREVAAAPFGLLVAA
jgi:hypothetical protein